MIGALESTCMAEPSLAAAPPRVPFVISVGVTGHRAEVLGESNLTVLGQRVRERSSAHRRGEPGAIRAQRACFAAEPPMFRFVSPIADGADQVAAEAALELGWELQVIMPFAREAYRASLANHGARERFDTLLERAACVLELPGEKDRQLEAYVMTGRATVAHCDILMAIWDGLPRAGAAAPPKSSNWR